MMVVSDAIKDGLMINHMITFISLFTLTKMSVEKARKKPRFIWSNDLDINKLYQLSTSVENI
jgi:hypothetical protein